MCYSATKTFFTLACSLPSIFFVKIMLLCSSKRIYLSFLTSSEDSTINQYPNPLVCQKNVTSLSLSVTRLEDLLDFGQLFKTFVNNYLSKSPTFLGNFSKGVKIYHFSIEIIQTTFIDIWRFYSGHTALPLPLSLLVSIYSLAQSLVASFSVW